MTNLTVFSPTEINSIKFAIDKIEEIRNDIKSENQENKSKDDLITSIFDIEEVLAMVSENLETAIAVHAANI